METLNITVSYIFYCTLQFLCHMDVSRDVKRSEQYWHLSKLICGFLLASERARIVARSLPESTQDRERSPVDLAILGKRTVTWCVGRSGPWWSGTATRSSFQKSAAFAVCASLSDVVTSRIGHTSALFFFSYLFFSFLSLARPGRTLTRRRENPLCRVSSHPVAGCYSRRRHSRMPGRRDWPSSCTRTGWNRWRSAAGICTRTVTRENKLKRKGDREVVLGSGSVVGTSNRRYRRRCGNTREAGCERKCREWQPAIYGRIADRTHSDHSRVSRREEGNRQEVLLKKERELCRHTEGSRVAV